MDARSHKRLAARGACVRACARMRARARGCAPRGHRRASCRRGTWRRRPPAAKDETQIDEFRSRLTKLGEA
eukprot:3245818-Pleurochrysis_carterae.AAC.1